VSLWCWEVTDLYAIFSQQVEKRRFAGGVLGVAFLVDNQAQVRGLVAKLAVMVVSAIWPRSFPAEMLLPTMEELVEEGSEDTPIRAVPHVIFVDGDLVSQTKTVTVSLVVSETASEPFDLQGGDILDLEFKLQNHALQPGMKICDLACETPLHTCLVLPQGEIDCLEVIVSDRHVRGTDSL